MKRLLSAFTLVSLILCSAHAAPVLRSSSIDPKIFVDFGEHPAAMLTARQPFTLELWANFSTLSYYGVYCFTYGPRLVKSTSVLYAGTYSTSGTLFFQGTMTSPGILANTWHHIAFSYDGTNVFAYQNGELRSSKAFTYTANPSHFIRIGGQWHDVHARPIMSGQISEYRLWRHARSAGEIAADQYRRLSGREPGLRGYWPCLPSATHDLEDYSTNAMHGAFIKCVTENVEPDPATTLYFEDAWSGFPLILRLGEDSTGSTDFFSGATLVPVSWVDYSGMDALQITLSDDPSSLDPDGWTAYSGTPATLPCPLPAAEGPVTLHLWYTNLTADVALRRESWSMVYTLAAPVVSAHASLSRLKRGGSDLTLNAWELDAGSGGGTTQQGVPLAVDHIWLRLLSAPDGVSLTDAPVDALDLPETGDYTFELIVRNNAGVVATSTVPTAVTVTLLTETSFTWTGAAGNGRWEDAGNWDPAAVPDTGDTVTVPAASSIRLEGPTADLGSFEMAGGTLTFTNWTTCLRAAEVTLGAGSELTCVGPVQDAPARSNRVWIVCSNLTLAAGSEIDVSEKGYAGSTTAFGVGPGGAYNIIYAGASHGGAGGYTPPYGEPLHPETLGSSGSQGTSSRVGGHGGGAIRIDATGDVVLHGQLKANGNLVTMANSCGAGAGGSIWITCRTLSGQGGEVLADGGLADASDEYSPRFGSGGRIAVHYDAAAQETVAPAPSITFSAYGRRALGTLYFTDNRFLPQTFGDGTVKNGVLVTPVIGDWSPAWLVLDNASIGLAHETIDLAVAGDIDIRGTWGRLFLGASGTTAAGVDMRILNTGQPGRIVIGGSLILTNGAAVRCHAAATNGLPAGEPWGFLIAAAQDITVARSSWIYSHAHPINGGVVKMACRDFLVPESPGGVQASTFGYMGVRNGPGLGPGASTFSGRGAGYGGYGGVMGGRPYGSLLHPTQPGSAGAWQDTNSRGSDGGGAIWIEADRHVVLNGTLLAEAQIAQGGSSAVGSGGAVLIDCHTFAASNGVIRADSKPGQSGQAFKSGGGGRIAIHYDTGAQALLPVPTLTVSAWTQPLTGGDVGTIYFPDARLLGHTFGPANTIQNGQVFLGDWSGWAPGSLTVAGANVRLCLPEDGLSIPGNLTVRDSGILGLGGDSAYFANPVFYHPLTEAAGPVLTVGGDLVLTNAAMLHVFAGQTHQATGEAGACLTVGSRMLVGAGCTNRLYAHPLNGRAPVVRVQHLVIRGSGAIDASAFGWCGLRQNAESQWLGLGSGAAYRAAASHGGAGGWLDIARAPGSLYGSSNAPVEAGSCGAHDTTIGTAGGGVVHIEARTITCAGAIRADGGLRAGNYCGGSGGSVYLRCQRFTGSVGGILSANGGGGGAYPSGGGGRVAIWREKDLSESLIAATALAGPTTSATPRYLGQPGSVVWGIIPPVGTVIILR